MSNSRNRNLDLSTFQGWPSLTKVKINNTEVKKNE